MTRPQPASCEPKPLAPRCTRPSSQRSLIGAEVGHRVRDFAPRMAPRGGCAQSFPSARTMAIRTPSNPPASRGLLSSGVTDRDEVNLTRRPSQVNSRGPAYRGSPGDDSARGLAVTIDRQPAFPQVTWARQGSNLRPLGCKPSALPLSYAPGRRRGPYLPGAGEGERTTARPAPSSTRSGHGVRRGR